MVLYVFSMQNSDDAVTPCSSSDVSPAHCHGNQAHATATAADGSESRDGTRHSRALLEDLDFLPTKDDSGGAVSQGTYGLIAVRICTTCYIVTIIC